MLTEVYSSGTTIFTNPQLQEIYAYDSDYLIEETNAAGTAVARY